MLNETALLQDLKVIMTDLEFPNEAVASLLSDMKKIAECAVAYEKFSSFVEAYDRSTQIDYTAALNEMKEISAQVGVHNYTCNMLHYLSLCKRLRERYAERGLSDKLFVDTMKDLTFKLGECQVVHGIWGTFVPTWYARFFYAFDRFYFVRLQFEPIELRTDCTVDGVEYKKGMKVLNVHIPRTGTRLDHGAVVESYRAAAEFYKKEFEGIPLLFVCQSWLLFPKHDDYLAEGSNMLAFAHDYTVISTRYFTESEYSTLWRAFDRPYNGNPDEMPTDTALQRAYVDMLKKGEPIGSTFGVIVYESFAKKWNIK